VPLPLLVLLLADASSCLLLGLAAGQLLLLVGHLHLLLHAGVACVAACVPYPAALWLHRWLQKGFALRGCLPVQMLLLAGCLPLLLARLHCSSSAACFVLLLLVLLAVPSSCPLGALLLLLLLVVEAALSPVAKCHLLMHLQTMAVAGSHSTYSTHEPPRNAHHTYMLHLYGTYDLCQCMVHAQIAQHESTLLMSMLFWAPAAARVVHCAL
jgi:hypothetical protein